MNRLLSAFKFIEMLYFRWMFVPRLVGLFLILFTCFAQAQPRLIPIDYLDFVYFVNMEENKLYILHDSINYETYDLTTGDKSTKKFRFISDESFQYFQKNYLPVFDNPNDIMFVDYGCGRVYQWRNDSIVRMDHSFHHKNQFLNATFYHKGTVYLYGGYGFFQFKNIITRYDRLLNEWFLFETLGEKPPVTPYYYTYFENGKLTVFNFTNIHAEIAQVYQLDFDHPTWKHLGRLKAPPPISVIYNGKNQRKLSYFILENALVHWNVHTHSLEYFNIPKRYQFRQIHQLGSKIIVLAAKSGGMPFYFLVYDKEDFTFPLKSVEKIQTTKISVFSWVILGLVCLCAISLMAWIVLKKRKRFSRLYFSKTVIEVLKYWLSKADFQIELSELNDFVDYDKPSMETLKKRREILLKSLKGELMDQFKRIDFEPFEFSSHPQDRRIKVLSLNPVIASSLLKGEMREK